MYGLRAIIVYHQSDEVWAARLRRALSQYAIPISARADDDPDAPTHLGPISMARIGAALDDATRLSLAASDYLIFLASPAAATSPAMDAAARVFTTKLRGRAVIPVITGGEPGATRLPGLAHTECLPPALRFAVDAQGAQTPHPATPDVIDGRRNGVADRAPGRAVIDDVRARIAARMTGAPVAVFTAQDRRRGRRRGFATGVAAAAALVVAGGAALSRLDADQAALTDAARQAGIAAHRALDRGDAAAATAGLIAQFPADFPIADPPYALPAEATGALSRTAFETRLLANLPAPVADIATLRLLPAGALAAISRDGAAHLLDLGAGDAAEVYAPKGPVRTRVSDDGATLWTARFGPVGLNEDGDVFAPLMFEDVALATGDVALKTAVQSVPANGASAISPGGDLFAVDAGPGDGERTLVAVFHRAEQALAGVATFRSDRADLTFLNNDHLLVSINPASPYGVAPGLSVWDIAADRHMTLRPAGAAPVCPGAGAFPPSAIARELREGRLNKADWAVAGDGAGIAMLLPSVTGRSCLMRWSADGKAAPVLSLDAAYRRIAFAHRGFWALERPGGGLTVVGRDGRARSALTGCGAEARLFAPDAAEPVIVCAGPEGFVIHHGLSGQRYWRGPPIGRITAIAHDPDRRLIIAATADDRIRVFDAAPRGWPIGGADAGLTLARAGDGHVVASHPGRAPRFFTLDGARDDGVSADLRASAAAAPPDGDVLALTADFSDPARAACAGLPPADAAHTALSPGGLRLAVETTAGVSVYDMTTCQPLIRLPAHTIGGGPILPSEDRLWLPLPGEIAVFPLTLPPATALAAVRVRKAR